MNVSKKTRSTIQNNLADVPMIIFDNGTFTTCQTLVGGKQRGSEQIKKEGINPET